MIFGQKSIFRWKNNFWQKKIIFDRRTIFDEKSFLPNKNHFCPKKFGRKLTFSILERYGVEEQLKSSLDPTNTSEPDLTDLSTFHDRPMEENFQSLKIADSSPGIGPEHSMSSRPSSSGGGGSNSQSCKFSYPGKL